jgi:predicted ester cyclase
MSEENTDLARSSWEEIVNKQNPEAIDEFYAADFVWHEPDEDIQGSEQAKQFVSMYFAAFPDINVTVEDVIGEGDKAVTRWTIRGTHRGEIGESHDHTGTERRSPDVHDDESAFPSSDRCYCSRGAAGRIHLPSVYCGPYR